MRTATVRNTVWEQICLRCSVEHGERGALDRVHQHLEEIPRTTLQRLQEGAAAPRMSTLQRIASLLGCEVVDLLAPTDTLKNADAPGVSHVMSHLPEQTPSLTREELIAMDPKGEFWAELWDEAIGQELPKGTLTLWDASLAPEVGDFVLIRTADGRPHVRVYAESLAHGWQGKALHSDYEPIPGGDAKVLAVFVSAKVRRSQLRR